MKPIKLSIELTRDDTGYEVRFIYTDNIILKGRMQASYPHNELVETITHRVGEYFKDMLEKEEGIIDETAL